MDDDVELPPTLLPGYERRQMARAIIALTLLVPAVGAFLFLAAPGTMGGPWDPRPLDVLVPAVGIGMYLVGLGWMARIYRASIDIEPDHGTWRYRSR
jgi:hypothetical protein